MNPGYSDPSNSYGGSNQAPRFRQPPPRGNAVLHGRPLQTGGGSSGTDFSAPRQQHHHQAPPPTQAYAQQSPMGMGPSGGMSGGGGGMDYPSVSHSIPLSADVSQQPYGGDAHGSIGMGQFETSMHQRSTAHSHGHHGAGAGGGMGLYQNIANIAVGAGTRSEGSQAVGAIFGNHVGAGVSVAESLMGDGLQQNIKTLEQIAAASHLQTYFQVTNRYVLTKLRLLLFPFRVQTWQREKNYVGDRSAFKHPREDDQAPDLYIPLMAFITYVLLMGYLAGLGSLLAETEDVEKTDVMGFSPETLVTTATKALFLLLIELAIVRFGMYLLGNVVIASPWLDSLAYAAYKFVGVVINMVIFLPLGMTAYYVSAAYTGVAMLIFTMRTHQRLLIHPGGGGGGASNGMDGAPPVTDVKTANYQTARVFLLLLGIVQPALSLILGLL